MHTATLSLALRQQRTNIRSFLITATVKELKVEFDLSVDRAEHFRAECIQEMIDECRKAVVDKYGDLPF